MTTNALRRGDLVQVLSAGEFLATLDQEGNARWHALHA